MDIVGGSNGVFDLELFALTRCTSDDDLALLERKASRHEVICTPRQTFDRPAVCACGGTRKWNAVSPSKLPPKRHFLFLVPGHASV